MLSETCYVLLPDKIPSYQLAQEFERILSDPHRFASDQDIVDSLCHLGDRQWHSYTLLDKMMRDRLSQLALSLWSNSDTEIAEGLMSTAAQLGLVDFFENVKSMDFNGFSSGVKAEVQDAITELGDTIADPYRGLR